MSKIYPKSEIAKHNGKNGQSIWVIYKGNVYDVTDFVQEHPGGADLILEFSGKDATKAFDKAGHSPDAVNQLKQYQIGEVAIDEQPKLQTPTNSTKSRLPLQSEVKQAEKSNNLFLYCC